jgi:hypothetical protein
VTTRAGAMPFGSAVSAARWGHRPVGALARVRDVRAVEDLSHPGAQHRFGDGGALAPGARREVQRRVVQDLQGDTGPALLERLARDGRGETAPGALSAHGQTAAVPAVLAAVLGDPPDDLEGLPGRGGERVLRGHDVVDVDHGHPRLGGEETTERIVGLRQRHHVPATVEVDVNRRRRTHGRRQVHHDPGRSDRVRDRQLAHGAGEFGKRLWEAAAEPRRLGRRSAATARRCIDLAAKEATPGRARRDIRFRSSSRVANQQDSWQLVGRCQHGHRAWTFAFARCRAALGRGVQGDSCPQQVVGEGSGAISNVGQQNHAAHRYGGGEPHDVSPARRAHAGRRRDVAPAAPHVLGLPSEPP